ncbi:UNKNOWN [Stylonychia lemnae]|uniref:Uncharacterized protein n=1 Tax=Stylonychia lemnae TaxID=5949 RepID=A0A078A3P3_STYLE|nr:UNKNOWN [Stylonychia lemnae]|eukprot:CDW75369.1 UNKNOWN [Stylonychia lemnae]
MDSDYHLSEFQPLSSPINSYESIIHEPNTRTQPLVYKKRPKLSSLYRHQDESRKLQEQLSKTIATSSLFEKTLKYLDPENTNTNNEDIDDELRHNFSLKSDEQSTMTTQLKGIFTDKYDTKNQVTPIRGFIDKLSQAYYMIGKRAKPTYDNKDLVGVRAAEQKSLDTIQKARIYAEASYFSNRSARYKIRKSQTTGEILESPSPKKHYMKPQFQSSIEFPENNNINQDEEQRKAKMKTIMQKQQQIFPFTNDQSITESRVTALGSMRNKGSLFTSPQSNEKVDPIAGHNETFYTSISKKEKNERAKQLQLQLIGGKVQFREIPTRKAITKLINQKNFVVNSDYLGEEIQPINLNMNANSGLNFRQNRPPPMVVKESEYFSSMTSPVSSNYQDIILKSPSMMAIEGGQGTIYEIDQRYKNIRNPINLIKSEIAEESPYATTHSIRQRQSPQSSQQPYRKKGSANNNANNISTTGVGSGNASRHHINSQGTNRQPKLQANNYNDEYRVMSSSPQRRRFKNRRGDNSDLSAWLTQTPIDSQNNITQGNAQVENSPVINTFNDQVMSLGNRYK